MTEVVIVGHGVVIPAGGIRGQIQALVKHVELERSHAEGFDQIVNLKQLIGGHDRQMKSVVGIEMSFGKLQHFRKNLAVGAGLIQVVVAGAEVAEKRGDAAY